MDRYIAEKAGLVYIGKNDEGEDEYIGTDEQRREAERLEQQELEGHGIPDLDHTYPDDFASEEEEEINEPTI